MIPTIFFDQMTYALPMELNNLLLPDNLILIGLV